ncbi:unnamed protein product [Parascedosporium putredinis]|uniref:Helicase C-terminal domain-containing protein n=1 Tax=Parascedosporium putredinis TaxID=1442378 RepID=A0A9P1GUL8_9PEZI|nr:unnamed protein product [Parascedosporium putredinis]CAI7987406.1 unnamed protein product [Parascedosporium putredinis]
MEPPAKRLKPGEGSLLRPGRSTRQNVRYTAATHGSTSATPLSHASEPTRASAARISRAARSARPSSFISASQLLQQEEEEDGLPSDFSTGLSDLETEISDVSSDELAIEADGNEVDRQVARAVQNRRGFGSHPYHVNSTSLLCFKGDVSVVPYWHTLQNVIGEFFSLVQFLDVRPFSTYMCRSCPCELPNWNFGASRYCSSCSHGALGHFSVFNQEILIPIQRHGQQGAGQVAFQRLLLLTDRIMLRRLKKNHTESMELPTKELYISRQFFSEPENDSADHYDLVLKRNAEGGQNILECCICESPAEDAITSKCSGLSQMPHPLSIDLVQPEIEQDQVLFKKSSIVNRIRMDNWTSSSKIELLVHELFQLRSENSTHKSIIFSQFTSMLQLIEWRLRHAGLTTVMLDGTMTPAQRNASINHFMTNVDVECFLVSLKAGGVALNLTEASRVFLVEP